MAGDWMKVEKTTPDKPEIEAIAAALGIDPDAAFGKCFRVWRWFDDHTTNGNAPSVTKNAIDRRAGVTGFADAMEKAGWLQADNNGVSLPQFDRHNGETSKARALTAKRVANSRSKSNAECNAPTVTSPLAREEKRREEDNTKKDTPPTPKGEGAAKAPTIEIPAELNTPEFRAAWESWQKHRHEKRQKLTPTSTRQQLAKLAAWGADRAAKALLHSIANGWTGIFEPQEQAAGNGKQSSYDASIDALAEFATGSRSTGICPSDGPFVRTEENRKLH